LEFQLPGLSADMEYATIGRWLKEEGDSVRKDEPLLEIDADKVTEELPAPASGTLREILAVEGGIYSGPCTTGAIRPLAPPTVTPQPPAPFRDVFAKYTIGPV